VGRRDLPLTPTDGLAVTSVTFLATGLSMPLAY
jgi:hypothetical protein